MIEMIVSLQSGETKIKFERFSPGEGDIVVTDSNLSGTLQEHNPIVVPAGEASKNLRCYEDILNQLAAKGAKRKTNLVAIGGGVIGDLAGFVAATYMRGIPLTQVPTTLLAMVDSSVGGKVGVDTDHGKNLVGAFYPAREVFVDVEWLKTLPKRQWKCGMAEVIKYGFIMDSDLVNHLDSAPLLNTEDSRVEETISRCIQHKKQVVEADEFETTGYRAILNFGHTVGHAIEKLTHYETYTHGEAIAIGMAVEAKIGEKLGICASGLSEKVIHSLKVHGLPTDSETIQDVENIIQSMRGDKKSVRGELSMSLLSDVGSCKLVHDIPEAAVREVLSEY